MKGDLKEKLADPTVLAIPRPEELLVIGKGACNMRTDWVSLWEQKPGKTNKWSLEQESARRQKELLQNAVTVSGNLKDSPSVFF